MTWPDYRLAKAYSLYFTHFLINGTTFPPLPPGQTQQARGRGQAVDFFGTL
jgi:hypothetical protein